jgi:twitching motility protein PilT
MSKPIYEIPVTGADEAPGGFPPPAAGERPTSYASAPPPSATMSAPPATGWPQAAQPTQQSAPVVLDPMTGMPPAPGLTFPPPAPADAYHVPAPTFQPTAVAPSAPSAPSAPAAAAAFPPPTVKASAPPVAPVVSAPLPVASAPAPTFEAPAPVAAAPVHNLDLDYSAPVASAPVPVASAPAPVASAPMPTFEQIVGSTPVPVQSAPVAPTAAPSQVDPGYMSVPLDASMAAAPPPVFEDVPAPAPSFTAPASDAADFLSFPAPQIDVSLFPEPSTSASLPVAKVRNEDVDFGEAVDDPNADKDLIAALRDVLMFGASDLHISAKMPPMVRVDGALMPSSLKEPWSEDKVSVALRSIMSASQQEQFERELELDFAYTVSANARFRVNFYQQREVMGAAFRLIPTDIKPLAELGVPDSVARFATLARGLVLVTGPTGSGKSTTLASLIDVVNRTRADHIMTVEDPIEFMHTSQKSIVNQREVGADTHSFGNALKHVLRQDPDVILIGELRDLETISVALTAAETGHLVFATLHTQDAAQTIDRIIDVFPPHQQGQVRSQLAATLQGVVCQTLVKKASGHGRAVATEILIATPAVANLIREGKTYQISSAMQAGGDLGMHTMDRHLADLVDAGVITQKAAEEKAQDVEALKQMIHRVQAPQDATDRAIAASSIDYGDAFSTGGSH